MKEKKVLSFAKINLSIDVKGAGETGYHEVDMIMQQLSFHDDVTVSYDVHKDGDSIDVDLTTNRFYLPSDSRNLAYKAAELMISEYGSHVDPGTIKIDIVKRIPVAGGLAGGSGNAAAVLHALNDIWDLKLGLTELCTLGEKLGSDVPFCVRGQARANRDLPGKVRRDKLASSCMRARGRGTELTNVTPLMSWIVIAKPRFSVSTKEVYDGIDDVAIKNRPNNDRLETTLRHMAEITPNAVDRSKAHREGENLHSEQSDPLGILDSPEVKYMDFINVLETFTLTKYPEVGKLKELLASAGAEVALMSGSGPTVFGVFDDIEHAQTASDAAREAGYEAYWTKTTM